MSRPLSFRWGSHHVTVDVTFGPHGTVRLEREGAVLDAAYRRDGRAIALTVPGDGEPRRALVAKDARGIWVSCRGRTWLLVPEGREGSGRGSAESSDEIRAPMTGRVVSVAAQSGAPAKEGDLLLVIEAMKMEFKLTAPADGTVIDVACAAGDRVELGQLLVRLQPTADGSRA